jgi:homoserine O-succinyltransferase
MPIKIPTNSPAEKILTDEGVELIESEAALRQDIRPLRILLFNLMPMKLATEVQIARLLSHTPLQVELKLLTTDSYTPQNTSPEHLQAFYATLNEIRDEKFDGMIVTGAPVEQLPFEDVRYWREFLEILEWSKHNVFRRLHLCWAGQAALWAEYGIEKVVLDEKVFGLFEQRIMTEKHPILRGFPDLFVTPASRYSEVRPEDIEACEELEILVGSESSGVCMVGNRRSGDIYMFNHLEYDTDTLKLEYLRDLQQAPDVGLPHNYFVDDDSNTTGPNVWRPLAYLMFSNWTYWIYEDVPHDLKDIAPR